MPPQSKAEWLTLLSRSQAFDIPALVEEAPAELRRDRDFVSASVRRDGWTLRFADESLKADRAVALAAVRQSAMSLQFVAETLKADRETVLVAVSRSGWALQYAAPALRSDKEIVLAAVQRDGRSVQFASHRYWEEKEQLLTAMERTGWTLEQTTESLKSNRKSVLTAAEASLCSLDFSAGQKTGRKTAVLDAIDRRLESLLVVLQSLEADKEILLAALEEDARSLQYAPELLKANREVMLAIFRKMGVRISGSHENEVQLFTAAVAQNPSVVRSTWFQHFLSGACKLASALVADNPGLIREAWFPECLRADREVVLAAVRRDGASLEFARGDLRSDAEVVAAATEQNPDALEFVQSPSRGQGSRSVPSIHGAMSEPQSPTATPSLPRQLSWSPRLGDPSEEPAAPPLLTEDLPESCRGVLGRLVFLSVRRDDPLATPSPFSSLVARKLADHAGFRSFSAFSANAWRRSFCGSRDQMFARDWPCRGDCGISCVLGAQCDRACGSALEPSAHSCWRRACRWYQQRALESNGFMLLVSERPFNKFAGNNFGSLELQSCQELEERMAESLGLRVFQLGMPNQWEPDKSHQVDALLDVLNQEVQDWTAESFLALLRAGRQRM